MDYIKLIWSGNHLTWTTWEIRRVISSTGLRIFLYFEPEIDSIVFFYSAQFKRRNAFSRLPFYIRLFQEHWTEFYEKKKRNFTKRLRNFTRKKNGILPEEKTEFYEKKKRNFTRRKNENLREEKTEFYEKKTEFYEKRNASLYVCWCVSVNAISQMRQITFLIVYPFRKYYWIKGIVVVTSD